LLTYYKSNGKQEAKLSLGEPTVLAHSRVADYLVISCFWDIAL